MLALLHDRDVTLVDPEKLDVKSTISGGAKDFWYFFAWDGFRPRPQGLDQPVTFGGDSLQRDSLSASSTPPGGATRPAPPLVQDTSRAPARPGAQPAGS